MADGVVQGGYLPVRSGPGGWRVYRRLMAAQIRAQRQYRVSFAVDLATNALFSLLDMLTLLVVFRVTPSLGGFGLRSAFLMISLTNCGFALADLVTGNLDRLRLNVRTGTLDALLVRPLGLLPQLVATDFAPRRFGRAAQGVVVFVVALAVNPIAWNPSRGLLVVLAPAAAALFFSAWFVAGATVAFWWIESGEFANGFTYGGREFTGYPMTVYSGIFRRLFGYGLGFAFVSYYPALALLGRHDPLGGPAFLGWCTPAVGLAAALLAAVLWRTGVRHYRSTGS